MAESGTVESTLASRAAEVALLRKFASLLSTHRQYVNGEQATSSDCLQQHIDELPRIFVQENASCSIPCLQLRGRPRTGSTFKPGSGSSQNGKVSLADVMRGPLDVERISDIPLQLLTNCSRIFQSLLQAAVFKTAKSLLSLKSTTHARLLAKMAKQPPNTVVTMFKPLEFDGILENEASAVVPIVFQLVIDWKVSDGIFTTKPMEVPGVLQGEFVSAATPSVIKEEEDLSRSNSISPTAEESSSSSPTSNPFLLQSVTMDLDTSVLLSAMMAQVKVLVRRALSDATALARQQTTDRQTLQQALLSGTTHHALSSHFSHESSSPSPRMRTTTPAQQQLPSGPQVIPHDDANHRLRSVLFEQATYDEYDDDFNEEDDRDGNAVLLNSAKTPLEALFESESQWNQQEPLDYASSEEQCRKRSNDCVTNTNTISSATTTQAVVVPPRTPDNDEERSDKGWSSSMPPPPVRAPCGGDRTDALSVLKAAVDTVHKDEPNTTAEEFRGAPAASTSFCALENSAKRLKQVVENL